MRKRSSTWRMKITGILLLVLFACSCGWDLSTSLHPLLEETKVQENTGRIEGTEHTEVPQIIDAGSTHEVLISSRTGHGDDTRVAAFLLPSVSSVCMPEGTMHAGNISVSCENHCTALEKSAGNYAVELVPRSF